MTAKELVLGQYLQFTDAPIHHGPDALHHENSGAILISEGIIQEIGPAEALRRAV